MNNSMNCLGSRILELRQKNKMTQEELAGRLGITPQALSKWERGQSYPDVWLLKDICTVLGVSADRLLGNEIQQISETGDEKGQREVWENLQGCLSPLELIFGRNLVKYFTDGSFMEYVPDIRKRLSNEGILMPIVRIRDEFMIGENEFMILSYDNVLYSEDLKERYAAIGKEDIEGPAEYIRDMLLETVRNSYGDIITPDIVKNLTDNLEHSHPAIIKGIVPEKISYGMLNDIIKAFMKRGNSIKYLEKIIEYSESILRQNKDIAIDELTEQVAGKIERKDNYWVYMANRKKTSEA